MQHQLDVSRRLFPIIQCLALLVGSNLAFGEEAELPLIGETETLTINTNTGSWVSVDVTPDGETLVFDLLGDLYTLPINGGEATAITTGMGYDSQPQVSPDGQWITFVSDRSGSRNVWIARIDGSDARKLSDESQWDMISPTWSPDGRYVLVLRNGADRELIYYHVDGGSGVGIGAGGEDEAPWGVGAEFSPDGHYVYVAANADSTRPVNEFPTAQIARIDLDDGSMETLTQGIGGGVRPAISPDGQQLVYGTRHDAATGLRIRDLTSGADRWLTWPVQRDAQENYRPPSRDLLPGYAFTPDGNSLVLSAENRLWRVDVASGEREEIPFSVEANIEIGPDLTAPYRLDDGDFTATLAQSPAISPDGTKVVASILTKLYLMDLENGAEPTRLTGSDLNEYKPTWSEDGRWLAYSTWSDTEGGHLWQTRGSGRGNPRRLTNNSAFYTDIVYHPDGESIFALRGNGFQRQQTFSEFGGLRHSLELVEISTDSGDERVIMAANGARGPHFGSDPDRLFLTDETGLFSIDLDGNDLRREMDVTAPRGNRRWEDGLGPDGVRISPDGQHALIFARGQLWVVATVASGGKAPSVDLRGSPLPLVRLTDIGADSFGWADSGETIWWAIGHTIYQRALDSVVWREDETEEESADSEECDCDSVAMADDANDRESGDADTDSSEPVLDENDAVTAIPMALQVERDRPEGALLLSNANLIAMSGTSTDEMGQLQSAMDVLLENGRISAIGAAGTLDVPTGTTVLDLSDRYLVPGFIDTHAHWEFRTDDSLEPHTWSLAANLAYGVTTGLDVQTASEDYFAYRDMVESGQTIGQRALMTGPGIFGINDFESYEAAHAFLRRYADHYRTHNIKAYLSGNREQRQWIVQASEDLGLLPTTEGGGDMELDITHAIDGMHGNEHTLPDHPLGDDVIQLYAKTRTAYTPTLIVQYNAQSMREYFFTRSDIHDDPKLRRFYPSNRLDELTERRPGWQRDEEFQFRQAAADAARIQRAGGLVGVGGHAELQGLGYHWEMWAFAMGGMTPAEVLRAATIDGAVIVGIDQDLGSIEAGKIADLLILTENPLQDIRNTTSIESVIKDGKVYEGDTLDQQWPDSVPFKAFWWWDAALPSSG